MGIKWSKMDLSFILSDICISWISSSCLLISNISLFLIFISFIFRWMQINVKYSFKYALVLWPAPPFQTAWVILLSPRPCLLPWVGLSQSCGRERCHFQVFLEDWPLTTCSRHFDVTRLQKDLVSLKEMGSHCHNQHIWTFKTLEFSPISAGREGIAGKERRGLRHIDWHQQVSVVCQPWNVKERTTFELDCLPTVLCTVESRLQRGRAIQGKKSIKSACHSLISEVTKTHLVRCYHLSCQKNITSIKCQESGVLLKISPDSQRKLFTSGC